MAEDSTGMTDERAAKREAKRAARLAGAAKPADDKRAAAKAARSAATRKERRAAKTAGVAKPA